MTPPRPISAFRIATPEECQRLFAGETSLLPDRAWPVTAQAWLHLHQTNLSVHHASDANQPWWLCTFNSDSKVANALAFVPPMLPCFTGHFPGQPLLPGVLQLDWATKLAALLWPSQNPLEAFAGTARLKFKAPIRPADIVCIKLTAKAHSVTFDIRSHSETLTSGRLLYRERAPL